MSCFPFCVGRIHFYLVKDDLQAPLLTFSQHKRAEVRTKNWLCTFKAMQCTFKGLHKTASHVFVCLCFCWKLSEMLQKKSNHDFTSKKLNWWVPRT